MTERIALPLIGVVSVLVPVVVALLLFLPEKGTLIEGINIYMLPLLNACINSTVTLLLALGYFFVRQGKIRYHTTCMISAFVLSALFLVSYIIYHYQAEQTRFGGEGLIRYVYFFILITHILLATTIVPLALLSIFRGLSQQIDRHRRIARWTLPIWLYVSITGVIVYLMISPYYPA